MGYVNQGDIVRVTAKMHESYSGDIQNVFYFRNDGALGMYDSLCFDDLSPKLEDVYSDILSVLSNNLSFVSIDFYDVTAARPMADVPWPTLTQASDSGDRLPQACSAMVLYRTGVRRTMGRKFFGPLTAGQTVDGKLISTAVTAFITAGSHLLTSFLGAGSGNSWLPGIPAAGAHFWSFEDCTVKDIVAYQRRRREGRGS